jgi:maleate isomerase
MNRRRIAIVTPYVQETNRIVQSFLYERGIDVVNGLTFDILSGYAMARLSPKDIYSAAMAVNTEEAEAIFISCTGLQVSPVLADLQQALGKPVVSSNQALTWLCSEKASVRRIDNLAGALFGYRFKG